jgi:spermidine synthase
VAPCPSAKWRGGFASDELNRVASNDTKGKTPGMATKQRTKPQPSSELEDKGLATGESTLPRGALLPGSAGLKLLVFVSGAVLMGLEIVGSRLLAPYFGNSVFVWGSLISLFLIALSAGYYAGGRVADRHPSQALLNSILIGVSAWLFAIAAMAGPVCEAVSAEDMKLGEKWGPLLAAAILFLLPSIGMGVVSPFAVRLATHTVASVGKTSGTLYALSTIGSIAGTMITTFVLIPSMGAGEILKGLAAALLATAVITFPFASRKAAATAALVAALAGGATAYAIDPARIHLTPGAKLLVDVDTPYHHISVVDDPAGYVELRFDRFVESRIENAEPYRSLSAYTNYFHLAFLPQPNIKRVLFIGAGGGVGPRSFHQHDPTMKIEVVDIDAKVLELARSHFHMDDVDVITTAVDGRTYVRQAPEGAYDVIVLDAFSIGGRIPFHLVTREFLELCRDRLAPGGVFLMNINSAVQGPKSQIFQSMYKTAAAVFPENTHAFMLGQGYVARDESTNIILVGLDREQAADAAQWRTWAEDYRSASYITPSMVQQMVTERIATLPEMKEAPVFTDDFAPIETMTF